MKAKDTGLRFGKPSRSLPRYLSMLGDQNSAARPSFSLSALCKADLTSGAIHEFFGVAPFDRVSISDRLRLSKNGHTEEISLNEIVRIEIRPRLLGNRVVCLTKGSTECVLARGVPRVLAESFVRIAESNQKSLFQIERDFALNMGPTVLLLLRSLELFLSQPDYISHNMAGQWFEAARLSGLPLDLNVKTLHIPSEIARAVEKLRSARDRFGELIASRNEHFEKQALLDNHELFEHVEKSPLTQQQRLACVRNENRNLVVAGAGTGKTSTIIARIAYLLKRTKLRPEEILVVAFARKAKEELEERIQQRVGLPVPVCTFHSLGLAIIGHATGRKPSLSKLAENDNYLTEQIGIYLLKAIDNPRFARLFAQWFWLHVVIDRPPEDFPNLDAYYRYEKSQGLVTLTGVYVKSLQEVSIGNWLTLHGIKYEYEATYKEADTASRTHRAYKPDFYLPDYGIYIEHFGINEQGTTAPGIDAAKYLADMEWKRELHRKHQTKLVETFSFEFTRGSVFDNLESQLRGFNVAVSLLPIADLRRLATRQNVVSNLCSLLKTFLKLHKSSGIALKHLKIFAPQVKPANRTEAFLEIYEEILSRYQAALKAEDAIDFSDMVNMAVGHIASGRFQSQFRQIIVDEFQDIAADRRRLVMALLNQDPLARLFVVGDDWQSIFRFTGSDISLMTKFSENFGLAKRTDLDMTFRFSSKLAAASSRFVTQNGAQLAKTIRSAKTSGVKPIQIAFCKLNDQAEVKAVLEPILSELSQIGTHVGKPQSVMILGRYNHTLDKVKWVEKALYRQLDISTYTAHRSKGLEADYVVVLDLVSDRMGFPSQIADDPILNLVLSARESFPNAEERRLFYVALTRARERTFLITDRQSPSSFVEELCTKAYGEEVKILNEDVNYEPVFCRICQGRLMKRIGDYGTFWGCRNYPLCEGKGDKCPHCDGAVILDGGEARCNNRQCQFAGVACPQCQGGYLALRSGRYGEFLGCSRYPACDYTRNVR